MPPHANEEQAMAIQPQTDERRSRPPSGDEARERLLAAMPVAERRLELAGVSTAVLEGGDGPPVVLLHGPLGYAAHWMGVIPGLVPSHRVVVPDLPGHGASEVGGGPLDADRVLAWLDELIERTCASPPAVVAQLLGGAIAARFAIDRGGRLSRLVLVDTLGLRAFEPAPEFGIALHQFLEQPTERTHQNLWRHCAFDLDSLRQRTGDLWQPFEAYNLDRARTPRVQAALSVLMEQFGMPAIPTGDLARIAVPTTLIWGRHDRATPLAVAAEASARFGWPLHVIENCNDDPPVEQPAALLRTLRDALDGV
jgi:pimeloyl-ACP methyl ester carboxylesterase